MRAIVVYLVLCFLFPVATMAKKKPLGNGVYWELSSNGVLTISGNGKMPNYFQYGGGPWDKKRPWHSKRSKIHTVVIEEGITSTGTGAFSICYELKSISLPGTLTEIGMRTFEYCGLENILIPNSVTTIGKGAFWRC